MSRGYDTWFAGQTLETFSGYPVPADPGREVALAVEEAARSRWRSLAAIPVFKEQA